MAPAPSTRSDVTGWRSSAQLSAVPGERHQPEMAYPQQRCHQRKYHRLVQRSIERCYTVRIRQYGYLLGAVRISNSAGSEDPVSKLGEQPGGLRPHGCRSATQPTFLRPPPGDGDFRGEAARVRPPFPLLTRRRITPSKALLSFAFLDVAASAGVASKPPDQKIRASRLAGGPDGVSLLR